MSISADTPMKRSKRDKLKPKPINHFRYDSPKKQFKSSQIQKNTMVVDITLDKEGYHELNGVNRSLLNVTNRFNVTDVPAVADTGAAVCCAPSKTVTQMGLKMSDTFRSRVCLYAADSRKLIIKGCLPVSITVKRSDGTRSSTRELIYFVDNIKDVLLSHEALMDLGSIGSTFPQIQTENSQIINQRILTSHTNQTPSYADITKLNLNPTKFINEEINPRFHTPLQSPALSRASSRSSLFTINSISAVIPPKKPKKVTKSVKGQTSSESPHHQHPLAPATPASIITKVPMDAPREEIVDIDAGMYDDIGSSGGAAVTGNYFHFQHADLWRPWL